MGVFPFLSVSKQSRGHSCYRCVGPDSRCNLTLVEFMYLSYTRMPGEIGCTSGGVYVPVSYTRVPGEIGCTSGGVYVPCVYSHAG